MTFNRIITVCAVLAMLVSVSGCGRVAEAEQIPLPVLDCKKKISVEQGSDFKIDEYCTISPAEATVSLMSEPDTEEIGLHTLSVLVSDGQHNNFLIKNLEYEVVKAIPECPDNSEWNEESESCKCVDGYKDMGEDGDVACEIVPVCEIGYRYDEKTNTCIKKTGSSSGASNHTNSGSGNSSSGSNNNSGGSGSSSGGSSGSTSSSSSESYTIDYEDYQPGNGQYDVTITDNNPGESTTVTTEDPPMPGASDDEFFDWINDQLP